MQSNRAVWWNLPQDQSSKPAVEKQLQHQAFFFTALRLGQGDRLRKRLGQSLTTVLPESVENGSFDGMAPAAVQLSGESEEELKDQRRARTWQLEHFHVAIFFLANCTAN